MVILIVIIFADDPPWLDKGGSGMFLLTIFPNKSVPASYLFDLECLRCVKFC